MYRRRSRCKHARREAVGCVHQKNILLNIFLVVLCMYENTISCHYFSFLSLVVFPVNPFAVPRLSSVVLGAENYSICSLVWRAARSLVTILLYYWRLVSLFKGVLLAICLVYWSLLTVGGSSEPEARKCQVMLPFEQGRSLVWKILTFLDFFCRYFTILLFTRVLLGE